MTTNEQSTLGNTSQEFLKRDRETHPPLHAPDVNTLDEECRELVENVRMDHPASKVVIASRIHEREV